MTLDEILKKSITATARFVKADSQLLKVDANERSLTHKLAEHLQDLFPDYNVDCEYNRLGDRTVKRLPQAAATSTNDTTGKTIFPDIIIHTRGERNNLLLVEMKKTSNNELGNDVEKLEKLTEPNGRYGYTLGIHLVMDCHAIGVAQIDCYAAGHADNALTERARELLAKHLESQ